MISKSRNHPTTHPQLRSEFRKRTGNEFWLYKTDEFLSSARDKLKIEVSDETIEYARELRSAEKLEALTPSQLAAFSHMMRSFYDFGANLPDRQSLIANAIVKQAQGIDFARMDRTLRLVNEQLYRSYSESTSGTKRRLPVESIADDTEEHVANDLDAKDEEF